MVSQALSEDWDPADCLCQGKVPEAFRIDLEIRIFDEKRDKWRWKPKVRYHKQCPIHGLQGTHGLVMTKE
jgi:hypothetical protein